jgi:hypothetical protein
MAATPAEIESWRNPAVLVNTRMVNAGFWLVDWAKAVRQAQPRSIRESPRMKKKDGPCGFLICTNTEDSFC